MSEVKLPWQAEALHAALLEAIDKVALDPTLDDRMALGIIISVLSSDTCLMAKAAELSLEQLLELIRGTWHTTPNKPKERS